MTDVLGSAFVFRGLSGRLRRGGRFAARIKNWSGALGTGGDWTLTAVIDGKGDPFWLTPGVGFELSLSMGANTWRWPDVTVEGVGATSLAIRGHGRPEVI